MMDEYGAFGGMRISKTNGSTRGGKLPQFHFVHHKSHMTRPGIESKQLPVIWDGHSLLAYFPFIRKRQPYEATVFPLAIFNQSD
jgi:hypothetical protein